MEIVNHPKSGYLDYFLSRHTTLLWNLSQVLTNDPLESTILSMMRNLYIVQRTLYKTLDRSKQSSQLIFTTKLWIIIAQTLEAKLLGFLFNIILSNSYFYYTFHLGSSSRLKACNINFRRIWQKNFRTKMILLMTKNLYSRWTSSNISRFCGTNSITSRYVTSQELHFEWKFT
jgi:hypothetical protein